MTFSVKVTARAPGSVGNVGPGLDVLGAAISSGHDTVTAEWCPNPGVFIADAGHPSLPTDASRNTAGLAAIAVLRLASEAGVRRPPRGVSLTVTKGLPISGGQGGSAASAVAAAVAVNTLIGEPLDQDGLFEAALAGEELVAGRHLDNIAPSLLGGICLVRSMAPFDVLQLPIPNRLRIVLAQPEQTLETRAARAALPAVIERGVAIEQMANVGAMVAALYADDLQLLGRALRDQIAEPSRTPLLPGFVEAKQAALDAGALGASISGAGPTAFALCDSDVGGLRVAHAMRAAYEAAGINAQVRVCHVESVGARVETGDTRLER